MTMRLSIIALAGMARTLVAVGTSSEADMFLATAAAAPRSTWFSSSPAAGWLFAGSALADAVLSCLAFSCLAADLALASDLVSDLLSVLGLASDVDLASLASSLGAALASGFAAGFDADDDVPLLPAVLGAGAGAGSGGAVGLPLPGAASVGSGE